MVAVLEFDSKNCPSIIVFAFESQGRDHGRKRDFSSDAIGAVMAEMKAMVWMHKSGPPGYRDGKQLSGARRLAEGVQTFVLPLTTHDPSTAPSWAFGFETQLLDAAKPVYLQDPTALPATLVAIAKKFGVMRQLARWSAWAMCHRDMSTNMTRPKT